jgi:RNA polymerase sigma factor (sigma-70 family)
MSEPSSNPADDEGEQRVLRARSASGDPQALEQLLVRNLPGLRAYVRLRLGPGLRLREGDDDLVQSVCRELIEDWPALEFPNEAAFRGWLFQAALNKVRERARYHGTQKRDVQRELGGTIGAELLAGYAGIGTPSAAAMSEEALRRFETAFDRLPDEYREVITLARLVGLPLAAIGERMGGRTEGAVSMLLARALTRLGLELGPDRASGPAG